MVSTGFYPGVDERGLIRQMKATGEVSGKLNSRFCTEGTEMGVQVNRHFPDDGGEYGWRRSSGGGDDDDDGA